MYLSDRQDNFEIITIITSCARHRGNVCFNHVTKFNRYPPHDKQQCSATSLVDHLKHLHLFGETFGVSTKTSTSVIVEVSIPQAIERLEQVYSFDKKRVDADMSLIGTTAVTQGPQGTVSSVVMENARRILTSLRVIKDLLDRFNPRHTTKLSIKSLLTNACCKTHFQK